MESKYNMDNFTSVSRSKQLPQGFQTFLAWSFHEVLPGTFKRNKKQFAHLDYPILAPLPKLNTKTAPLENCGSSGPFIYFVLDRNQRVCYVGKSKEANVVKRWVRPGIGGPASHYWTHSTSSGGSVFNIAKGIRAGEGPFNLRYVTLSALMPKYASQFGIQGGAPVDAALAQMESGLIAELSPSWNQ